MSSQFKKYFFIVLIISTSLGSYWYFFAANWGVAIEQEHIWKHSFQSKGATNNKNIGWGKSKKSSSISETNKTKNLVFQTEFTLVDYTKILEGTLEFGFRYSAKILINGKEFSDINRNLITSSLEGNKIKIYEYWRPRIVTIDYKFLQKSLKNGLNTITLVVYNVESLKTLESNKKQLSFLSKGRSNQLKNNFKIQKPSSFFEESSLPIFKVNTNNNPIPDEPKIASSLKVIDNKSKVNKLTDSTSIHNIKIEVRGNTSQSFAKKSYSFNVYNQHNKKIAIELLGLPASKKWVLYGPFADKSLIRNTLTYSIYTQMGNYAPRTKFVNLVINDNYQGIYVLTEKIQISPKHVNITPLKIEKNDSSRFNGGYILEIDRNKWKSIYPPEKDTANIPTSYIVYAPKEKKINPIVRDKIVTQYNSFEKHLYENNDIYNYLDLNSFIDYLIITEFTKNIDGYCLSTFLYNKNINNSTPKFYIGTIWDYNFSLGLTDYNDGFNPDGFVYNSSRYIPFWWEKLLADKTFKLALEDRYFELRKTVLSNSNIFNKIDSLSSICLSSNSDNFKKWPVLNSEDFWPNYFIGETYNDEINYLKSWIKKRLHFLDKNILAKNKKGVNYFEISIRNNPDWMGEINRKAKDRNITVEEMIVIDANHMAKKE
jgi:spore coat protein CotH